MDDNLFDKILKELADIDYDGDLALVNYNEPLADADLAARRVRPAKLMLPRAKIQLNTNGDYLTRDMLDTLAKAGLDRLAVSIYTNNSPSDSWEYDKAEAAIINKAQSIGIDKPTFSTERNSRICVTVDFYKSCNVTFNSQNFHEFAYNRGASISYDIPLPKVKKRNHLCTISYTTFSIYFDGQVTFCCNFRPDFNKHNKFIIGNVNDKSIFSIYTDSIVTQLRKEAINDFNMYPCNSCTAISDGPHAAILNLPNEKLRNRPRYRR
jgi:radical SAM protein with 4Fe4S-binding SPASM domain